MRLQGIVALAVVALSIAACGGGGGGGSAPSSGAGVVPTAAPTVAGNSPATNAPLPAGYAVANVVITVPKTGTSSYTRKAQTVGANTASISFTLLQLNGAAANSAVQTYGLTSSSPGCATQAGNLVCSLNIDAPIGSDVFLAQTFSGAGATGSLTGSGAVALTVAQNHANTASLSLDGQVSSVYLASSSTFIGNSGVASRARGGAAAAKARRNGAASSRKTTILQQGSIVSSMRVFVIALDSAGNTVLNPSTYDQPITIQMIYTGSFGIPDTTSTPDVSLTVAYNTSVDPTGCGGNATATASFATVQVCSPSDTITANFLTVANGAEAATLIASVSGSADLSAPATSAPTSIPTGFAPGVGSLSFFINTVQQTAIETSDYYGYNVSSVAANGLGSANGIMNLPIYSFEGGGYNTLYLFEGGFVGQYTVGGTCGPYATLALTNNDGFGDGSILITPTAATAGCNIVIGDGTNSVTIPLTVTSTTVSPIS